MSWSWAKTERLLATILTAPDPAAAAQAAARDRRLPADLRRRLAAADADGLRLSALLVVRLRFERLLRGSPEAEAWFDEDPAGFAAAFKRYASDVPARAFFPRDEAALFSAWSAGVKSSARGSIDEQSARAHRTGLARRRVRIRRQLR